MPDVIRTRRLGSCHDTPEASSPVPRGQIIRRAGRVDRRPLRHLQGARGLLVLSPFVPFTINNRIYRVHASAFPARALSGSGGLPFSSLFGRVGAPLAVHWRSTRRGTPRPCLSVMPCAVISRVPPQLRPLTGSCATARVRRPTLTTMPSSTHPRSLLTLPTAPPDRRRPYNPRLQLTGMRLLLGAARRQAHACS
jgi:hypothetical protein